MFFLGLLRAAEAEERLTASFGRRKAALEVFVNRELEVGRHFYIEFAIESGAAKNGLEAVKELAEPGDHLQNSFCLRMLSMGKGIGHS